MTTFAQVRTIARNAIDIFRQDWQNYLDDQKISTGIPVALASFAVCAATYEGNNLTNY